VKNISKNYIFITNIPTPYRNSFYNELRKEGLSFIVYFENETESDRDWLVSDFSMNYEFEILRSYYFNIDYIHIHLNPKLIFKMLKLGGKSEIIFGLNWNDPNMLVITFLKKIGIIKAKFHFWSEANILTIGSRQDNIFKKHLRRFVFDEADGSHIISGKATLIALEKWGIKKSKNIELFNTIDDEIFSVTAEELDARGKSDKIKFIIPVRLIEKIKGFMNFFNAIGVDEIRKHVFYVAGDGVDRRLIQNFININKLQESIILIGSVEPEEMPRYYALADAFILPSFSDPCPLTVIEAMSMKLPVLISKHCGNHYEVVKDGANGYTFDPLNKKDIADKFAQFVSNSNRFKVMGELNFVNYSNNFKRKIVIQKFINQLNKN